MSSPVGKRPSLRIRLTLWMVAVGVFVVASIYFGGRLMVQASLDDQRQSLSEQIRLTFQSQRALLDQQAVWMTTLLGREGTPVRQDDKAYSSEKIIHRLSAVANTAVAPWHRPDRLTIVNHQGGAVSTWRRNATTEDQPACSTLRALASHWRGDNRRPLAAGICVSGTQTHYVALVPIRMEPQPLFLEISTDLRPTLRELEKTLQFPLQLIRSDGATLYRADHWPSSAANHLRAEVPVLADTGSKALLVLAGARPSGSVMQALAEVRPLAVLFALSVIIVVAVLLIWYLERTVVTPLAILGKLLGGESGSNLPAFRAPNAVAEVNDVVDGVRRLDHQLRWHQQALEQASLIDATTCLPNRSAFLAELKQSLRRAPAEAPNQLALLVLDLDGFKDINDTLGLQVGDTLLRQVGERLRSKLRSTDAVSRVGGDEFAMLLRNTDARQATTAARLLMQALHQPFVIEDQILDIGSSIGIALYPDHGVDPYTLMQHADVALQAAQDDVHRYRTYDETLDSQRTDRLILLGDLRRAIEQEQFELYYQPKVDLVSRCVTGVEALMRWRHPREGLLLPQRFIPLLEQTGLIRSLTPWLVNEAMRFARRLHDMGHPLTVSINLSARDLQDPHLADTLAEPLAAHRIDPSLIELEITESAVMDEPERARQMLEQLSELGFRLAIDDFGTGYSSFSYLKRMPVNTLKIDKSFVLNMLNNRQDTAIVRTSVDLAHHFGLHIVAEGVENAELLDSLQGLACDSAQGFYLSRPLEGGDLLEWLQQSAWGVNTRATRSSVAR